MSHQFAGRHLPGAVIYDDILPEAVKRHAAHLPYWNGSPYGSVGGDDPNSRLRGDTHEWFEGWFSNTMDQRINISQYDNWKCLFASEYGYSGPCVPASIRQYTGESNPQRKGEIWRQHTNTVFPETLGTALIEDYGVEPEALSLEDWAMLGGIRQGRMLAASLDALRAQPQCHGALYWMFNDCWGETGWTTIDTYLRRKPSFFFVQRALEARRLVIREVDGHATVRGINTLRQRWAFMLKVAFVMPDGDVVQVAQLKTALGANERNALWQGETKTAGPGVWVASAGGALQAVWYQGKPADIFVRPAGLELKPIQRRGQAVLRLRADRPAHGVCVAGMDDAQYLDVLPGFAWELPVDQLPKKLPRVTQVDLSVMPKPNEAPRHDVTTATGQPSMF